MFLIKDMPKFERPRERLIKQGVSALSNTELIAILLRTGSNNKSVIDLSKDVCYQVDAIQDLNKITLEELKLIPGIKEAKAATIIAAIELGKRLSVKNNNSEAIIITSSYDIYYYMKDIELYEQEHFFVIFLDSRLKVIKKELIYVGTVNEIIIHPRDIFKQGIKYNASSVIFVHNHPTGVCKPSHADDRTTKVLRDAAQFLYIEMLDHIIIGKGEFYSYKEQRIFKI